MNKRYLLIFALAAAAFGFLWATISSKEVGVTSKPITSAIKPINYDDDLDYVIAGARRINTMLPTQVTLASDVISACEKARILFAESFKTPIQASIDFILQVHADSSGAPPPPGYNPERSKELISQVLLANKYDLVTIEGSGFDGYSVESQAQEIAARLKYEPTSPLYVGLLQKGIDPTSYFNLRPHLIKMIGAGNLIVNPWVELEKKAGTTFLAGESVPLSTFVGRFIMGEISNSRDPIVTHLQRIRSAYAVAKTIADLKERQAKRGAVIFGFTHEDDFYHIASSLGIEGKIYNATGR
jgi:hypothetical protein